MPLEDVCRKMREFGYDGLELACWGDHFDVFEAAKSKTYCREKLALLKKYDLGCWAISNHLAGQLICDPDNDSRSDGFAPAKLAEKCWPAFTFPFLRLDEIRYEKGKWNEWMRRNLKP